MTIPAIGAVSGIGLGVTPSAAEHTASLTASASLTTGASPTTAAATAPGEASASEALGAPESTSATEAPGGAESASGGEAPGGEGSFGAALGKALDSLERSQATGETAAAQVATGTTSDPEGAVVSVSNAELEMQLASQIRAKATEALQNVFQTQV